MDKNAELANFPQKCSFPADGLSPLADTSSTAGVDGAGVAIPSFLIATPLLAGVRARTGRVAKISSLILRKVDDNSEERFAAWR